MTIFTLAAKEPKADLYLLTPHRQPLKRTSPVNGSVSSEPLDAIGCQVRIRRHTAHDVSNDAACRRRHHKPVMTVPEGCE